MEQAVTIICVGINVAYWQTGTEHSVRPMTRRPRSMQLMSFTNSGIINRVVSNIFFST